MSTVLLAIFSLGLSVAYAQTGSGILVAAAADLAPLANDLSESFAKTGGGQVRFTFGASGMLAQQIAHGAPYDVYLSANEKFVRDLEAAGKLVPGSVEIYAHGRLGLWSKSGKYRSLSDLLSRGLTHLAIANPQHAPYGLAAREMLKGQGLWPQLEKRVVYGENVQQTFQFAETGNADACITAWSLVKDRGGVLLPAAGYAPITQTGAAVKGTGHEAAAIRFLHFLAVPEGKAVLARFGLEAR